VLSGFAIDLPWSLRNLFLLFPVCSVFLCVLCDLKGLCEILATGGTLSVKADDRSLFEDMDGLLSTRFEPSPASVNPSAEASVLTEWEHERRRRPMPIFCNDYRLTKDGARLEACEYRRPGAQPEPNPSSAVTDFEMSDSK
jgi:hypothetical protein